MRSYHLDLMMNEVMEQRSGGGRGTDERRMAQRESITSADVPAAAADFQLDGWRSSVGGTLT